MDEVAFGDHQGDFVVEAKAADVEVGGSEDSEGFVAGGVVGVGDHVLGVEDVGFGELVDFHAGFKECLVVGGLGVVDGELVGLFRDE